jgi:hypothetical protein
VIITAVERNVSVTTKTNNAGYYRVVDLILGKYRAHFEAGEFALLDVTDIQIPAGQVIRIDTEFKLRFGRQAVQVTAGVPLLETAPANISTTLDNRLIQEIPLQGRDLQQLVFLISGVNSTAGPQGSNFGFDSQNGTFPEHRTLREASPPASGLGLEWESAGS